MGTSDSKFDAPIDPDGYLSGEVVLPQNRNLIFAPTGAKLRGRWDFSKVLSQNLGEDLRKIVHELPIIPGLWIEIHAKERWVRICDPLEVTEEGRRLHEKMKTLFARIPRLVGSGVGVYQEEKSTDVSDTTLKNWLYHTTRLVLSGKLLVNPHSCPFPRLEEINKLPGLIDTQPFSQTMPKDKRFVKEVRA